MEGVQKKMGLKSIDEVDSPPLSFDPGSAVFRHRSAGCSDQRQNDIYHYHVQESFHSSENGRHLTRYYVGTAPSSGSLLYGMAAPVQCPIYQSPVYQLVTNIEPDDILSGRGGATNSHSGNRAFRALVKRYQDQYLQAKKRDKPAVASTIVEKIRKKGGRFLRRIDTTPSGELLWTDIGDDRAKEKTCQALREGAPGIRKKRKAGSADEDDAERNLNDPEVTFSSSSSLGRAASSIEEQSITGGLNGGAKTKRSNTFAESNASAAYQDGPARDEPIMIRPSGELTRFSFSEAISVDQLEPHDRELYLRDFLPPDPAIRHRTANSQEAQPAIYVYDCASGEQNASPWPVVQV